MPPRPKPATPTLRRNGKRVLQALSATPVRSTLKRLLASTPQRRVLGLDINTNSTGYAVLNTHGRVCQWGHISTAHLPSSSVLDISHTISQELLKVHDSLATQPLEWHVGIEDFMRMYRFGQYHNKGIFQLAQLNGIVSYTCWQRFRARPMHTHPTAARALFGINAGKSGAKMVKNDVMKFVLEHEAASQALQVLEEHRRGGIFSDVAYDMADAYIVAQHTRWMALQEALQHDDTLLTAFGDAYLTALNPTGETKSKSKQTMEEQALEIMDARAKRSYLHSLFVTGISDWIKTQALQTET
ncbi:hypothetical protein Poli38472_000526 [Pythium oligandrum]|uniref:Uncharacterized protein n=1 Tax=Pythium oligandrum TaxID=41045 RepID=A0A8K1CCG3_PYTOL|nr:hypothetical protein Poli38472_000526 [Pythium oligandrum]|eukprot:TMW60484.1 hypothetical protein Poli38472_000526 [Pythium oligandrum]